ncbi:MAG: hypothetical protein J7L43_01085 [Candidatus Aenigmarchaeota archaeon]|nr:hypothetical protein [Candidatus Aenigmarchaeota archaeon]
MIVHRIALLLKEMTAKKGPFADWLGYIFVDQDKAFATDAHSAIILKNPPQELADVYPQPPQAEDFGSVEQVALDQKTINRIEKNLSQNPLHPILNHFLVGKRDDKVEIFITGLDNHVQITQQGDEPEAPDIDAVLQDTDDKREEICLDLALLEKVVKVLKKMQTSLKLKQMPVVVGIPKDKTKAFTLEVNVDCDNQTGMNKLEVKALIMPFVKEETSR